MPFVLTVQPSNGFWPSIAEHGQKPLAVYSIRETRLPPAVLSVKDGSRAKPESVSTGCAAPVSSPAFAEPGLLFGLPSLDGKEGAEDMSVDARARAGKKTAWRRQIWL